MPSNFYYVGLIHLAMPNARIIHTMRDPIDTCLSCFSKLFSHEQNHTYDLGELGRFYRAYERLMDHWREILPKGVMIDVRYEDVVADLETQARRIIAHVRARMGRSVPRLPPQQAAGEDGERHASPPPDLPKLDRPLEALRGFAGAAFDGAARGRVAGSEQ